MAEDSNRRPTVKVSIEVYKGKESSAYVSYRRILTFSEDQSSIPSEWIKEFFSYLKIPPAKDFKVFRKHLDDIVTDTVSYFKKQTHAYYYDAFPKMIREIYTSVYGDRLVEKNSRAKCLRLIYKLVSDKSDKVLKGNYRYSTFKKCVVAGYVASKFALKVPTQAEHDDDAYNDKLFQKLKRYTK